jgi:AraC-like DNA-binding protein
MAETLLGDLQTPVTEVAEALHYATPAAFTRSCRRWFGDSPRSLRRKLAQRDASLAWSPGAVPALLDR